MNIPISELQYLIRIVAAGDTSGNEERWSKNNPLYGHCAVAAAVAQDMRGGIIQRVGIPEEWREELGFRSHYVNRETDGTLIDFSRGQFPGHFPYDELIAKRAEGEDKRAYAFDPKYPDTVRRYELLKERFEAALHSDPLYTDERFQQCWEAAFSAGVVCPKRRFGCAVYDGSRLVARNGNRQMTALFGKPRFCSLDGVGCKRLGMPSRVDANLGDCGHSIPWSIADVWSAGYRREELSRLDFYEAGFNPDGSPRWREAGEYTCADCEKIFVLFGLDKVWVPLEGAWIAARTELSFYSSADYLLRKKVS